MELKQARELIEASKLPFFVCDDATYQTARRLVKLANRTNLNRRSRDDAMRSIGMTKTPYGWE